MDDTLHRKYTGVSNEQILQNYKLLARCGIPFITRVPLIPTVSDTKGNLTATAEFMRQNGVHQIELLPYHITAGAKYKLLGRDYKPNFDTTVTPNPHLEIFESYGIEVRIL
jgi:pyruvate formate lyase activating enzyme